MHRTTHREIEPQFLPQFSSGGRLIALAWIHAAARCHPEMKGNAIVRGGAADKQDAPFLVKEYDTRRAAGAG